MWLCTDDGRVARATGQVTRAGALFDSVIDRYFEVARILGARGITRELSEEAARRLRIHRRSLQRKLKKLAPKK